MTDPDDRSDLAPLADVPAPRRTDDAFARAVRDGVRQRKSRITFALPTLAAAAAAFTFLVVRAGPDEHAEPRVAIATPVASAPDTASADLFDDDDALFALPELDGSSDEELAQLDRVLDRKLAQRGDR